MIGEPGEHGVADLIDLHEGRLAIPLLDADGIRRLLGEARRIAVIGASPNPHRPSNGVIRDLVAMGYEIVPINPAVDEVEGLPCHPDLQTAVAVTGPVDIVDVFRRAEACPPHAREAVAVGARCLWLQLGIASRESGEIATAGGLEVVMDRCLAVEARRR